jgi:hypothetical protein
MGLLPCGHVVCKLYIVNRDDGRFQNYLDREFAGYWAWCDAMRMRLDITPSVFVCPICYSEYTTDFELARNFVRRR